MSQQTSRVRVDRDLVADLAEQRAFLRSSASAYDAGTEPEAKRLALTLRLLLHETNSQRPLLAQMGVRDRIPWTDTSHGEPPPGTIFFSAGLATMRVVSGPGGSVTYHPYLGECDSLRIQPAQAFVDWWSETIMKDSTGNSFSRSALVIAVSNQDGGAHIDERLNAAYAALTRGNSLGFTATSGEDNEPTGIGFGIGGTNGPPFANSPALANIRQIAWEVENSLERNLVVESNSVYVRSPICPLSLAEGSSAGRNDPCPCGSGQKQKYCYGRREPRRFRTADPTQGAPASGSAR
jgi:hypothetical protein